MSLPPLDKENHRKDSNYITKVGELSSELLSLIDYSISSLARSDEELILILGDLPLELTAASSIASAEQESLLIRPVMPYAPGRAIQTNPPK